MRIPPHVQRKLQQLLGTDAGEDMVAWTEEVDTARGDIAELRHEMRVGFARIDARLDALTKWLITSTIVNVTLSVVAIIVAVTALVVAARR